MLFLIYWSAECVTWFLRHLLTPGLRKYQQLLFSSFLCISVISRLKTMMSIFNTLAILSALLCHCGQKSVFGLTKWLPCVIVADHQAALPPLLLSGKLCLIGLYSSSSCLILMRTLTDPTAWSETGCIGCDHYFKIFPGCQTLLVSPLELKLNQMRSISYQVPCCQKWTDLQ